MFFSIEFKIKVRLVKNSSMSKQELLWFVIFRYFFANNGYAKVHLKKSILKYKFLEVPVKTALLFVIINHHFFFKKTFIVQIFNYWKVISEKVMLFLFMGSNHWPPIKDEEILLMRRNYQSNFSWAISASMLLC